MNCANCGTYNQAANRFCLKCGTALSAQEAREVLPSLNAPEAQVSNWVMPRWSSYPPQYPYPAYSVGINSPLNVWEPFAGYGSRRGHKGWFLNSEGHRAAELVMKLEAKLKEREIPGASLAKEALIGRGSIVETRPYFILRRDLASLGLYISQFGCDLFVSQVSYLKSSISHLRVFLLALMLLGQGYMIFIYPANIIAVFDMVNILGASAGQQVAGSLGFLGCVIGPLGGLNSLILFLLLCFSVYRWLTARDFWAALRIPPNEFNEDDLMAMEKAVEETLRQSLTEMALDLSELKMVEVDHGGRLF